MARRETHIEQLTKPSSEVRVFVPSQRPPTPLLVALDDGSAEQGETWRIRTESFTIGRKEGDAVIHHDPSMSSRHATLVMSRTAKGCRWVLEDSKSRNGTFIRMRRVPLRHLAVFLIATTRFQFRCADERQAVNDPDLEMTLVAERSRPPVTAELCCLHADGSKTSVPLDGELNWLGTDPKMCRVVIQDDFANPRHALLKKEANGGWWLEDADSVNGIWLQVNRAKLSGDSEFRLGEQRFRFLLGPKSQRESS